MAISLSIRASASAESSSAFKSGCSALTISKEISSLLVS